MPDMPNLKLCVSPCAGHVGEVPVSAHAAAGSHEAASCPRCTGTPESGTRSHSQSLACATIGNGEAACEGKGFDEAACARSAAASSTPGTDGAGRP